ncbi:hypothetical protein KCP70_09260 [Salmonella enterica subsp. enterica]|nr:hypothetical protein KCP70_09260 [Salmonella enterica subsp. enterica]
MANGTRRMGAPQPAAVTTSGLKPLYPGFYAGWRLRLTRPTEAAILICFK